MGFFDKHNRLLRKKMQDLRRELERLERTGDYLVEEGVYFAALAQMGDATHMALAHGGYAEEEIDILRRFFNRNGFTCEDLRLDLQKGQVESILLIPPNEMIKSMIVVMQAEKFRVVDDGDAPVAFEAVRRICPVSELARVLAFLFVRRVRDILMRSDVKLTREGNRLLHWMPEIIDMMRPAINQDLVYATELSFDQAFEHFYERKQTRQAGKSGDSSTAFKVRLDEITGGKDVDSFSMTQLFPQNVGELQVPDAVSQNPEKSKKAEESAPEKTVSPISFEDFQFDEIPEEFLPKHPPRGKAGRSAEAAVPEAPAVREQPKPKPEPKGVPVREPEPEPEPEPEHEVGLSHEPEPFVIERTRHKKAEPDSREFPPPAMPESGEVEPQSRRSRPASISVEELHMMKMSERLGKTTTCMYETLVRAEPRHYLKTTAQLLELSNRHFRATASCIIARAEQGGMEILAQAGRDRLALDGHGGYAVNLDIVKQAGKSQKGQLGIVLPDGYCLAYPVYYRTRIFAVLYLMRPTQRGRYRTEHIAMLQRIARIFEDYPDLTLGLNP